MPDAIPAGGPPNEKSPHSRTCFDVTASQDHSTPEKFTADLAQRIADEIVIPVGTVLNVLTHANYADLVYDWKINKARRALDEMEAKLAAAKLQASKDAEKEAQIGPSGGDPGAGPAVDGEQGGGVPFDFGDSENPNEFNPLA